MNILFQCNEFPPASSGGIGVFVKNTAEFLQENGHKVFVMGMYDKKFENNYLYKVLRLIRIKKLNFLGYILNIVKFHLLLFFYLKFSNNKIEIIEYPDYEGYGALHFHKIPFVIRLHNSSFYSEKKYFGKSWLNLNSYLRWKMQSISIKRADRVIGVSNYSFLKVKELVNFKNGTIVYNYFEPFENETHKAEINGNYLLTIGSVNKGKGALLLLETFIDLVDKGHEFDLYFIGRLNDNSVSQFYDQLHSKYKNKIKFLGHQERKIIKQFIEGANLLIFPSFNENMPLTWIEALSLGALVIASNIPVSYEIFEEGKNGFITNLDKESICKKIEYALSLKTEEKAEIKLNAALKAKILFDKRLMMKKNLELWTEVIHENN